MEIDLSNEKNLLAFQEFLKENILTKNQAMVITDQTSVAFNQSVQIGQLHPIYESEGKGPAKVKLYLKSQVEEYAKNKSNINKK